MEKTRDEITDRPEFGEGLRADGPTQATGGDDPQSQDVAPAGAAPTSRAGSPEFFDWRTFDPATLQGPVKRLEREMTTYRDRLDELLEHEGQYVLIQSDEVVGYYPDQASALSVAVAKFGRGPYLIHRVAEFQRIVRLGNVL